MHNRSFNLGCPQILLSSLNSLSPRQHPSMKKILFAICFCCIHSLWAQDTLRIYFDYGSAKIPVAEKGKLLEIGTRYDLAALDHLEFIGMADTTGNVKSNLRLSEKRARAVANYCEKVVGRPIPGTVRAEGESARGFSLETNRRVEVVLHFVIPEVPPVQIPQLQAQKVDTLDERCFYVDYELLHHVNIRPTLRNREPWIVMETEWDSLHPKRTRYYAQNTKDGNLRVKPLEWKRQASGKLWWNKPRWVANMPQRAYDQYRVFTMEPQPCTDCHEDIPHQPGLTQTDSCIQVDYFLMQNMQYRFFWFRNRHTQIRVPKLYVNPKLPYFYACEHSQTVEWKVRKAKRFRDYYIADMPINWANYTVPNISRDMECCGEKPIPTECHKPMVGVGCLVFPNGLFLPAIETGIIRPHQGPSAYYIGFAPSLQKPLWEVSALLGIDNHSRLLGAGRFEYHFASRPWSMLFSLSNWHTPVKYRGNITQFVRLYAGANILMRSPKLDGYFLTPDIHLGIASVNTGRGAIIPRIYFQGVYSMHLSQSGQATRLLPFFQAGIRFQIPPIPTR